MERVGKLGHIGDTVRVKDGYARNFLLPSGNAISDKLDGVTVVIVRQAGETGQLYGSVSARDIAEALTAAKHKVERSHVAIQYPIKALGLHVVPIHLHPE